VVTKKLSSANFNIDNFMMFNLCYKTVASVDQILTFLQIFQIL